MFTIKVYGQNGYEAYSCKSYSFFYEENGHLLMTLSPSLNIGEESKAVPVKASEYGDKIIYVENMIGKTIDRYVVKKGQ